MSTHLFFIYRLLFCDDYLIFDNDYVTSFFYFLVYHKWMYPVYGATHAQSRVLSLLLLTLNVLVVFFTAAAIYDAIADAKKGGVTDNDGGAKAWDEGVAFYCGGQSVKGEANMNR